MAATVTILSLLVPVLIWIFWSRWIARSVHGVEPAGSTMRSPAALRTNAPPATSIDCDELGPR